MRLLLAAIVATLSLGAYADKLEVLCWKQPAGGVGQWVPIGGNPVGCLQVWNVVNNYWRNQCQQAAAQHQQALQSEYIDDQVTCQCVETTNPNDDPGGGNEGY